MVSASRKLKEYGPGRARDLRTRELFGPRAAFRQSVSSGHAFVSGPNSVKLVEPFCQSTLRRSFLQAARGGFEAGTGTGTGSGYRL